MREQLFGPEFFTPEEFQDKYLENQEVGIDVIIPIQNTNIFFQRNLFSIFREIPVSRLIVGNGGSTDNSIKIANSFPRVVVIDQSTLSSLGGCLRQLVEEVSTPFFIYAHSDVYLPRGFFETFSKQMLPNSWVESSRNTLIVHEQVENDMDFSPRSYSGLQIGDSSLLKKVISQVEDDFLYRNEDIIISELVISNGGEYRKDNLAIHLHQSVSKNTENEPAVRAKVFRTQDDEWERKTSEKQYKGLIKYLSPENVSSPKYIAAMINENIRINRSYGGVSWKSIVNWTNQENPKWTPYLKRKSIILTKIIMQIKNRLLIN